MAKSPKRVKKMGHSPHYGPSQLDHDLIKRVCNCLKKGNYRKTAFALEGVAPDTWSKWVFRGRKERKAVKAGELAKSGPNGQSLQAILVEKMEAAEAEAVQGCIQNVLKPADGSHPNPETILKFLRLRHPKMFNHNPAAHYDDESGEETKIDPMQAVSDRLEQLMGKKGDSKPDGG